MKTYLRSFQVRKNHKERSRTAPEQYREPQRVLVFDTETSADECQNLKFGSFQLYEQGILLHEGIFYEPENNPPHENEIIIQYCKLNNLSCYTRAEFITQVFLPEVFTLETLCVGFNLPFDLSRLAIGFGLGRGYAKEAFSLLLTTDPYNPRIRIQHIDSTKSFIGFTSVLDPRKRGFRGNFLDLKTLASTMTGNKHISLARCAEIFNLPSRKQHTEEHGKITPEYIRYNRMDVQVTAQLYFKLLAEFKIMQLDISPMKVYSEASLGKQALRQLGIKPFFDQNPYFSKKLLGQLMSAYYGGRVECRTRKQPVTVSVLDFLSMYPTTFCLMGLWDFLIADKITYEDCTDEIQERLDTISLEDLQTPDAWKDMTILVTLKPQDDILPVRGLYDEKLTIPNIGLSKFSIPETRHYALPDVIASKLLSGKTPIIDSAIRFKPGQRQKTLKPTTVLDMTIDPAKENFIKNIIEKRQEHKQLAKRNTSGYHASRQLGLKILANSTTYGIFIETTPKDEAASVAVYSNQYFNADIAKVEETGEYFNPVIAVHQIAGSRLLLAMAEVALEQTGNTPAYMDTDSLFVPPEQAPTIQAVFAKLNPYRFRADLLQLEKENILFYGISSKRYCLYQRDNDIITMDDEKYSLHGLGQLTNPFNTHTENWQQQIWKDILKLHYGNTTEEALEAKYAQKYSITKKTVSTPSIHKRFSTMNKGKLLSQQIKPFNFFLEGLGTIHEEELIKPITPFSKTPQTAPYESFIDYKTGKTLQGLHYWKTLDNTFFQYLDHPESKFENGNENGIMRRKHITTTDTRYIGKEVKNIDAIEKPTEYLTTEEKRKRILNMSPSERRKLGWSRQKHHYWKKKSILPKVP